MAEWNGNPSWTPKEQINGGQQFNPDDILSPEDFNAIVENMQYLYAQGGDFEVNAYPVGSIYMSTKSTSPASLFGGSWERIKDKFLLAAGSSYSAGATGGSATHTHGLENGYAKHAPSSEFANSAYSYTHQKNVSNYQPNGVIVSTPTDSRYVNWSSWKISVATSLGGTTDSQNSMPPYLAVYIWKRIA